MPGGQGKRGPDKRPRAARGSKQVSFYDLFMGIKPGTGQKNISAKIRTGFRAFEESYAIEFAKIVRLWTDKAFTSAMRSSIRNSMWVRSSKMQNVKGVIRDRRVKGEESMTFVIGAQLPEGLEGAGLAQELGRPRRAKKGRAYMVPLASWLAKEGRKGKQRNYADTESIREDLDRPNVFWLKRKIDTVAGKARLVLLYEGKQKRFRDKKGRITKAPRSLRKSALAKVATAMYLAYDKATSIYGKSNKKFAKKPRRSKVPLAAQFGLSLRDNAPAWFSRAAARSLAVLYAAIQNVKVTAEAMGKMYKSKKTVTDDDGELSLDEIAMRNVAAEVADAELEDLRQMMREQGMSDVEIEAELKWQFGD